MNHEQHRPARLVLVGVGGYGLVHARRIAERQAAGVVDLVAAVDPVRDAAPDPIGGTPLYADLAEALAAVGPVDVVVIAAPLGEHARLAETALAAGADVLLEKPPVATLADFTRLLELERSTGRVVQVGFQSLGSAALDLVRQDAFGLGPTTRVTARGAWSRTVGYWNRSPWAGRRNLGDQPVVDGVVTNALAHAVATALAVVGCRRLEDVERVDTDLYRANAIDSDDTSVVRVTTTAGLTVTCALTLCAAAEQVPVVRLEGPQGSLDLAYTEDRLEARVDGQARTVTVTRTDLLDNLLDFRRDGSPLLVPLASTGAFLRVLDAVATAEEPRRIEPHHLTWTGEGEDRRPVVAEVEHWLDRAVETGQTFAELGVPWAHRGRDRVLVRGLVAGTEVVAYRDGAGTGRTSTPRPYLHPVRTLGGVVVSATHPADHDWHTGVGMAIPDVNGSNLWGGRTYVAGRGYEPLDDHGVVSGDEPEQEHDGFHQRLVWTGHDGRSELVEQRRVAWRQAGARRWALDFRTALTSDHDVWLGSPGSKGRPGGGYGGFFWRLPRCEDVEVFTATARGEQALHGSVSDWVAWSADFGAGPGTSGPATLILRSSDAAGNGEPWFVRVSDYPGLGSALAWDQPVLLGAGETLERRFDAVVADGRLDLDEVAAVVAGLDAPAAAQPR